MRVSYLQGASFLLAERVREGGKERKGEGRGKEAKWSGGGRSVPVLCRKIGSILGFGISKHMCSNLTLNIHMVDSCPLSAVPDLFLKFLTTGFKERDMMLFN